MSLKAFHIVFILVSTLLCAGFGAWSLSRYFQIGGGGMLDLAMGIGSLICMVALVIYGRAFLKKLRHISYL